jgi:hypothetical protein
MKIRNVHLGSPAPLVHHFCPLMMTSSPSTRHVAFMLVASLDATAGSVMANPDRIVPSRSGSSHSAFCASEPYCTSTSALPVSGAAQLKTSGARKLRPVTSATGA